jgi:hypothetical protein
MAEHLRVPPVTRSRGCSHQLYGHTAGIGLGCVQFPRLVPVDDRSPRFPLLLSREL